MSVEMPQPMPGERPEARLRQLEGELAAAAREFWSAMYPSLREWYEAAGAPYGPGDDGLFRWLDQHAAQNQAEQEARARAAAAGTPEVDL